MSTCLTFWPSDEIKRKHEGFWLFGYLGNGCAWMHSSQRLALKGSLFSGWQDRNENIDFVKFDMSINENNIQMHRKFCF